MVSNTSPDYVQEVKIGHPDGAVSDTTKQGGIVSIVSLLISPSGSSVSLTRNAVLYGRQSGAFLGGWAADRIGRINSLFFAAIFALIGGALQATTQRANFILVARVVTGLGTGGILL